MSAISPWIPRLATERDIPAITELIPLSARALQKHCYSSPQIEAALGPIFGVDRQLIRDGTYFAVDSGGSLAGCGGWSKRKSLFGSDQARAEPDPELDPACDPARIRAFFIHPAWARRGIGRAVLMACEEAILQAGFTRVELVATLPGEPLYAAIGYAAAERYEIEMADGLKMPVVKMTKRLHRKAD